MSRYRKVEQKLWGDQKFRTLSPIPPCGQGLWLFLLTGPHTGIIPGLFRAGRAALAEELGWDQEAFDQAFGEVLDLGLAEADWKARVVWIPNAVTYNRPESPNVVIAWGKEFDLIPECALKQEAFTSLARSVYALDDEGKTAFREAFDRSFQVPLQKGSVKTLLNQEQEQEQKQKQEQEEGQEKRQKQPHSGAYKSAPPAGKAVARSKGEPKTDKVYGMSTPVFVAYANAFIDRYKTPPLRNAKVNSILCQFLRAVPCEDAPDIAAFYVSHNDRTYVAAKHPVDLLLRDAGKIYSDWLADTQTTSLSARQAEEKGARARNYARLAQKYAAEGDHPKDGTHD